MAEFQVSYAQPTGKASTKLMVLVESVHSESVPFGSLNPTEKLKTPNVEPKAENFCGFHKFISYIVSDVGKFAEFDGEIIIFSSNPTKMAELSPEKLDQRVYPGMR